MVMAAVERNRRRAVGKAGLGLSFSVAIIACNAATAVAVSRLVGADGRGAFALVVVFGALTLTTGSVGVPDAVASRHVAWTAEHWAQQLTLSFLIALPLTAVVVALALLVSASEASRPVRAQLLVLALVLPLRSTGLTAVFVLLARGRVLLHQALMVGVPICTLVAVAFAWTVDMRSVDALCWAAVVGATLPALAQLALGAGVGFGRPTRDLTRRSVGFGMRSWIGSVATSGNQRADIVVLSTLADASMVGVYANASSVASLALIAPSAFGARIRWAVAKNDLGGVRRWLLTAMLLSIGLAVVGAIGAVVLFEPVFGPEFADGRFIAAALTIVAPVLAFSRVLAIVVSMNGRPGDAARAEIIGLVVGLVALILMLPTFGLWAAVMASVTGYSVSCIVEWKVCRRYVTGVIA